MSVLAAVLAETANNGQDQAAQADTQAAAATLMKQVQAAPELEAAHTQVNMVLAAEAELVSTA
jgi:hypothetical protein